MWAKTGSGKLPIGKLGKEDSLKGDELKPKETLIAEIAELRQRLAENAKDPVWQSVRESEERYRIVTEISRDAIMVTDAEGRLLYLNPAMEELVGMQWDEVIGTTLEGSFAIIHPEDRERYREEGKPLHQVGATVHFSPIRIQHQADGHWIWIKMITTSYVNAAGQLRQLEVSQDITDQVNAEQERQQQAEQFRESQRLESLGILAGGIAHDFNNLLTPMLGDASLALLDLPRNSPARVRLQRIKKAAHRAAAITNQMLAYTGKKSAAVDPLDVSQLVRDMAQLLEGAASGKAELIYELAEDLPSIEADAAQLSQVVLNLITNAIESIKEGTMGRAILRTGLVESEKVELQFLYGDEGVLPGSYVFVEVVDSGCGMSAAIQAKIFDPFFTTKASGRGLGLAATIGTVRGHGGAIELESEVGQGTRFRVLFPSMGRRALSAESTEIAIEQWRGSGTALVVDDDEGVRGLVKEILERAGLKVLEAHDGSEAVEIFRNQDDEIDVVVLDRTMPRIGGEEAFDQIRQIRPDARIILLSGYSEESATWLFVSRGLDAFIHKPFEPMVLVDRVRRIFESRDRPKPSG